MYFTPNRRRPPSPRPPLPADLAPECASAYYRYGAALLYQAQDSGDVFGAGVKDGEEEEEEEGGAGEAEGEPQGGACKLCGEGEPGAGGSLVAAVQAPWCTACWCACLRLRAAWSCL